MSGQYIGPTPWAGEFRTNDGRNWHRSDGDYNTIWDANTNQTIMPYGRNGGLQ